MIVTCYFYKTHNNKRVAGLLGDGYMVYKVWVHVGEQRDGTMVIIIIHHNKEIKMKLMQKDKHHPPQDPSQVHRLIHPHLLAIV